jgi:tRNA A-37 threonylcarbamoyl transferase component Bud32
MAILCPACHYQNRNGARFCANCRAVMTASGSLLPPGMTPGGSLRANQTGMLPPNATLANRYLILRRVGQGGMGAVYQATDMRLPKVWAVKELSDAAIADPVERQQANSGFLREAQLLCTLDHPNIPKVVDSFADAGKYYLVMEFVEGSTLEEMLVARGYPFTEAEVRPWVQQLCSVLLYLHDHRPPVIFRDLKLENIMVNKQGQIKLIDFGIARNLQAGKVKDTTQLGTPGYAPPEQYGRGQTDERSDIYALGVTLHRLLTGYDPSSTPFNLPPVRQLNGTLSPTIELVITRSLETNPQNRWQNIRELQHVLQAGLPPQHSWTPAQHPTIQGTPPGITARQTSRPTARLAQVVSGLSPQQLALGVFGLVVALVMAILILGPIIRENFPDLWNNVPTFLLAGPTAYAAARRRGAAGLSHIPITIAFWETLRIRFGETLYPLDFGPLLFVSVLSALALEIGFYLLPRDPATSRDQIWQREIALFAIINVVALLLFYGPLSVFAYHLGKLALWLSAAALGVVGWFLGDFVQEWVRAQQFGTRGPIK